jgi:pimeloyl-ACP methyl ester carboxylesterase
MVRQMGTSTVQRRADPSWRPSRRSSNPALGINASDRLHLAAGMQTLIVWGEDDRMIPSKHGHAATNVVPDCRCELVPCIGHYPHENETDRFVGLLADFVSTTQPRL